ncbi:hypothetical protein DD238_002807 [Peronospora effusa]|uniref:Uncharacterized protein n=1 Tax=Peronospora effusa TaxID=542832 RepID=A0A3M6VPS3_9STRA|nr:hypothetical protein DD238_002807 [Peronospora effusa]
MERVTSFLDYEVKKLRRVTHEMVLLRESYMQANPKREKACSRELHNEVAAGLDPAVEYVDGSARDGDMANINTIEQEKQSRCLVNSPAEAEVLEKR